MITRRPGLPPVVLKIGTLDDPSTYGGAQMAIFTAEGQPFHLIADGVVAFEGLPPPREFKSILPPALARWLWRRVTFGSKASAQRAFIVRYKR